MILFGPTMRGLLAGLFALTVIGFGLALLTRHVIETARQPHAELRAHAERVLFFLARNRWSGQAIQRVSTRRYVADLRSNADLLNDYQRVSEYGTVLTLGPTYAFRIVDGPAGTQVGWIFMGVRFNNVYHLTQMRLTRINNLWLLDDLSVDPVASDDTAPDPTILLRSLVRPSLSGFVGSQ